MKKAKRGFTLIELTIVVAINGILATIAIPKFADLIRKSKEGATKGNLGALRLATTIYYAANEGLYPSIDPQGKPKGKGTPKVDNGDDITEEFSSAMCPRYMVSMPWVRLGLTEISDSQSVFYDEDRLQDKHGWGYRGPLTGEIFVSCTRLDTKGTVITMW